MSQAAIRPGGFLMLACAAGLVLLIREPYWLDASVTIWPRISQCVLTPDWAWQVPLASWTPPEFIDPLPYPVYLVLASGLVAMVGWQTRRTTQLPSLLLVIGMAGAIQPRWLMGTALAVAITMVLQCWLIQMSGQTDQDVANNWHRLRSRPGAKSKQRRGRSFGKQKAVRDEQRAQKLPAGNRKFVGLLLMLLIAAVCVLVDFGFVWLLLALLLIRWALLASAEAFPTKRGRILVPVVLLLGTLLLASLCGSLLDGGFAAAVARPISWATIDSPERFFSGLQSPWQQASQRVALVIWLVGFVLWLRCSPAENQALIQKFPAGVLLVLGLLSGWYWSVVACVVPLVLLPSNLLRTSIEKRSDKSKPLNFFRSDRTWVIFVTTLTLAVCIGNGSLKTLWSESSRRYWNPVAWNVSGPVVLFDLGDCDHWHVRTRSAVRGQIDNRQNLKQSPKSSEGGHSLQRLIADDRWDLHRTDYGNYADYLHDLRQVRVNNYLRTDNRWGGYKTWQSVWQPKLLIVPSTETDALRGLSMSPDWQIMGVDGHSSALGLRTDSNSQSQRYRCNQVLYFLEWPGRLNQPLENTIEIAGDDSKITVARVLLALRFPYAAMRFLSHDSSTSTDELRHLCWLEVAHRVRRNSGFDSLIDRWRSAVYFDQDHLQNLLGSPLPSPQLNELHQESESDDAVANESDLEFTTAQDDAEYHLRMALCLGDVQTASTLIEQISDDRQRAYRTLFNSRELKAAECYRQLHTVVEQSADQWPDSLHAEFRFYLGNLALEAGDGLAARSAYSRCLQLHPQTPFRHLCRLGLSQLSASR